ncbi:Gfo/Idh/MocA family protein [Streptomyces sp. NPDC001393]
MTIAVGLVGYGAAGRQHVQALEDAGFADVRAIVEENPDVETPPGIPRYTSWQHLLTDRSIRLVALCTPPGGRAELAEQALEAGKAVLLEKPPATSTAELDRLVETARRTGNPIGVMLQHRLRLPDKVLAWDWPAATSAVLEVSRFRPAAHFQRASWRGDPANALGGITAHLGVHYLDLACQLLGEPSEVRVTGTRELAPGIETRTAGVVRFAGGATLSFAVTAESGSRTERLDLLGPDRRLLVEDGRVTGDDLGEPFAAPAAHTPELRREVYRDMVEAIATGRAPRHCHLAGARAVTMILEALSAPAGVPV